MASCHVRGPQLLSRTALCECGQPPPWNLSLPPCIIDASFFKWYIILIGIISLTVVIIIIIIIIWKRKKFSNCVLSAPSATGSDAPHSEIPTPIKTKASTTQPPNTDDEEMNNSTVSTSSKKTDESSGYSSRTNLSRSTDGQMTPVEV
ncbi:uncharacterized protein LOC102806649 [Saccoglossus kowalevskii]|uniref:Uncharacterized protein LOC102806649 n=1 Tax=Saccoglossus kowalevskii TaxID=10224 RepID=A0ABM0LXL8_SACKO|nr:PREDICTED: uncharacterized protein LOC102806649 [Saccoglossus kowalevskii]